MPDNIEEPIKLPDIITDEWYNREVEKVKKAEILANRANAAKRKLAAGVSPIQTSYPTDETLPRDFEGKIPMGQYLNPNDPMAVNLASGRAPLSFRLGQKTSGQKDYEEKLKQDVEDSIIQKLGISGIKGLTSDAFMLVNNPTSFITKFLAEMGPEGLLLVLGIQFVSQVADQVFKMYSDQYGAGGWFDTRKLVLDQTKALDPVKTLLNIQNGTVYFSDDAGQRLKQRAPESSNTRTLRDGQARYNLVHIGE